MGVSLTFRNLNSLGWRCADPIKSVLTAGDTVSTLIFKRAEAMLPLNAVTVPVVITESESALKNTRIVKLPSAGIEEVRRSY